MDEDSYKNYLEPSTCVLPQTVENTESSQTTKNGLIFLWKCFQITGMHIDGISGILKRFKAYWFPFCMHSALIINISLLSASVIKGNLNLKIILACASTNVLSVASWHCMNKNRFKLKTLINNLISLEDSGIKFGNIAVTSVLAVYCAIPSIYAIICTVYFRNSPDSSFWLYSSSGINMDPCRIILLFVNANFYISLQVLFPGLYACAYCFLSYAIYKWLKRCESTMKSAEVSMSSKTLVQEYFAALETAELLERCFSASAFLIILMHVLHMFSLFATLLTYERHQFTVPAVSEAVVIFLTSVCSTLAIILFASLIPDQGNALKNRWRRYTERQVLEDGRVDAVAKLASDREIVALTACDVIVLKKRFVLSIFGALLTYGILVIQINK